MNDFSNTSAVAVSTLDPINPVAYAPDDLVVHHTFDGPQVIAVGPGVGDEKLRRHLPMLNERCRVTLQQLQQARAGAHVCLQ